jgi:TonB family protein
MVAPHAPSPASPPPVPAPRAPRTPAAPLPARALAALQPTLADPAVWIFPLILMAVVPAGIIVQGVAAISALTAVLLALQPRNTPRNWSHIVAVMLVLTVIAGLTGDAIDGSKRHQYSGPDGTHTIEDVELDEAPRLINGPVISRALEREYPAAQREAGEGGSVLLSFIIDESGAVIPNTVEVLESSSEVFEEPAMRVARRMRFSPAIAMGQKVKMKVEIPVTFQTSAP